MHTKYFQNINIYPGNYFHCILCWRPVICDLSKDRYIDIMKVVFAIEIYVELCEKLYYIIIIKNCKYLIYGLVKR